LIVEREGVKEGKERRERRGRQKFIS